MNIALFASADKKHIPPIASPENPKAGVETEQSAFHREDCPCKRTRCERHGNCALCREHHEKVKGSPVACERPTREEKREKRRRERAGI